MKQLNASILPPIGQIGAIFLLSLLVLACGGNGTSGVVGEKITVIAEISDDSDDLEIIWEITEKPENSNLSNQGLTPGESAKKMSFVPDAPGDFNVIVTVYQYNDEISTESFLFSISALDEELVSVEENEDPILEEDAVAELINKPDVEEPIKWYEEDERDEDMAAPESPEQIHPIQKQPPPLSNLPALIKKPTPKPRGGTSIPFDKNRFTIQVASKNNLEDAKFIAASLIDAGYDAYIQKAVFTETEEIWYRVRLGSYAKRETALAVAHTLSEFRKEKTWVDYVRYEY